MDTKRLMNRTLFFIAICAVVAGITMVFGEVNSLVGVAIVVIALIMLQRDLSVRPVWNICVMTLFTCMLGIAAYVSLMDPFLGIAVNIAVMMTIVFATVHDLDSPLHFPFILGYTFMLSVPVTAEGLPMRIMALIVGSVAIVLLNVIMNRNRMTKTSHNAVISICERISDDARTVMGGGTPSVSELESMCFRLNSDIYGRLHDRLFATSRDATVIGLTSSLMTLGRAVIEKERDTDVLNAVIGLMDAIKNHENGDLSPDEVCSEISSFIDGNKDADLAILASARTISSELRQLSEEDDGRSKSFQMPSGRRLANILKENVRRDSVTFTFAVRMSLMYALWAFVWQYWDLENAKWLLFTTAALVQPYIEGTWTKSCMRVAGTLVGAAGFAAIAILTGQDAMLMSVALMVISYVYTLIDPKRYDVMMAFITMTALLAVAASDPEGDVLIERLVFVLAGVVTALFANMAILPYRLKDENVGLGRRSLKVSIAQIESIRRAAYGDAPLINDPYLVLKSAAISQKMQMNDKRDPDAPFGGFINIQNAISSEYTMLQRSVADSGEKCRERIVNILDDRKDSLTEGDLNGLEDEEKEILRRTANLLRMHKDSRLILAEAALALPE